MRAVSIILVDDHEIFRDGLRMNLGKYPDEIVILGEAGDGKGLFTLLETNKPDVLLLDYHLPDATGIQIARTIKESSKLSDISLIMLSAHKSENINSCNYCFVIEAIDAGFQGYLLKDSKISDIVSAIKEVYRGEGFVLGDSFNKNEVNKCLIKDRKRLSSYFKKQNNYGLSKREVEVLSLLSNGLIVKEIGERLFISADSVTSHKDNIKQKLHDNYQINLRNTTELVVWAIKNNIIR
jgi:two-component system NarL family response regulator